MKSVGILLSMKNQNSCWYFKCMYILVRTLRIERSVSQDPVGFEECIEKGMILNPSGDFVAIMLVFFSESFQPRVYLFSSLVWLDDYFIRH